MFKVSLQSLVKEETNGGQNVTSSQNSYQKYVTQT